MTPLVPKVLRIALCLALGMAVSGCYVLRTSSGGAEADFSPPRHVDAADIALPAGYRAEAVVTGLTFPTGIAFDDDGVLYLLESGYSYGEVWTEPRLLRLDPGSGELQQVMGGGRTGPWTGVSFFEGDFYVTVADVLHRGKILKIGPDGSLDVLLDGIPSMGDHHVNGPVVGPDGFLYFGIGTVTNSGVIGEDNLQMGWLQRHPHLHDVPGEDIRLRDRTFETPTVEGNKTSPNGGTGAFSPAGTAAGEDQVIPGAVLATGSIIRLPTGGGEPELVAWGLRNPFGLAFAPDGALYATDNGYDDRGSRAVWGAADHLWRVETGTWYGWPDFSGERPLTDPQFKPPGKPQPQFLLARHPNVPPAPAAIFPVHSSANGFDFSTHSSFGHVGQAFVAQFGDLAPNVAKVMAPVGFKVARVDVETGDVEDFAVNRGTRNGPASLVGGGGLERPVAARFDPAGQFLYVVDFGVLTIRGEHMMPRPRSGVVWRIWRDQP